MQPFDVIITTYNRQENILAFVRSILQCTPPLPRRIIVVDTSNFYNDELKALDRVTYVRSNEQHQNQPYKRLVGALIADSPVIVFFDDDLELLDPAIFTKLIPAFEKADVVGATIGLKREDHQADPDSIKATGWGKLLYWLSGKPAPKPGKMSFAGFTGPLPEKASYTETLRGPIMAFRRDVFLNCPDNNLLALFDKRLVIPEDKLLSLKAQQYGKLWYIPDVVLRHPPNASTYFINQADHTKRMHLSRYVVNKAYCQFRGISPSIGKLHFWYYSFWRFMAAVMNLARRPNDRNKKHLKGLVDAFKLALSLDWQAASIAPGKDYLKDAHQDALKYKPDNQIHESQA
ncbi:MAG TPA: glycosyltransferase [Saprospiraceae bacterium]|nr:glycosyltransferase [Saprospiraceae bacterium]HMQ83903.1 glycosyltransferase [Saprospiraceae bacterium]